MKKTIRDKFKSLLESNVFWAVTVPGAIGGLITWFYLHLDPLISQPPLFENILLGPLVSMTLGVGAGAILITLLTDSNRNDVVRMMSISLIAGLSWELVYLRGIDLLGVGESRIAQIIQERTPSTIENIANQDNRDIKKEANRTSNVNDENSIQQLEEVRTVQFAENRLNDYLASTLTRETSRDLLLSLNSTEELNDYILDNGGPNSEDLFLGLFFLANLGLVNIGENITESNLTIRGRAVSNIIAEVSSRFDADSNDGVTLNIPDDDLIETIEISSPIEGNFNTQYEHWYRVNLQTNDEYIFSTRANDDSGNLADTVIALFRQSGDSTETLGSDDDSGSGFYSSLTESLEEGEYLLRVASYEEELRGEYVVEVDTVSEPRYLFVEDNILSDASALIIDGSPSTFSFDQGTESKWHRFEVNNVEAGTYRIETSIDDDAEMIEFGTDTVMTLFSYNEENRGLSEEGYDDDGGQGSYSLLNENLSPGTYYLLVNSFFGEPGEYRISVASVDEARN